MDIGKAFSFPFDDDQWVSSILICGALIFLPIIGWLAIAGYALETARNVMQGSPRPLPKWNNFGEKLGLGFGYLVVSVVYALPAVIVGLIGACVIIPAAASGDENAVAAALGTFFCLTGVSVVLSLILAPITLAAVARYVQTGSIGATMQVGEVVAMARADIGGWLVLWLLSIVCGIIAQLGGYVFVIGMLFTVPYAQAVFGHLLGQKIATLGRPAGSGFDYAPPPSL
jgi:hypothetical protein